LQPRPVPGVVQWTLPGTGQFRQFRLGSARIVTQQNGRRNMTEELVTPEEAVSYLRLDEQGLRQPLEALRWVCRTGQLKYTKVGRYLRFRKAWLDQLIEQHAVQADRVTPKGGA